MAPKSQTFYAVKWFVRKPKMEEVEVPIGDPRHARHAQVFTDEQLDPGKVWDTMRAYTRSYSTPEQNRAAFVRMLEPATRRVATPETVLTGTFQTGFQEYPEPKVRTRDPRCTRGNTPRNCAVGWHVPFLTSIVDYIPGNSGVGVGEAELWLVKVGGKHSHVTPPDNKVAFEYLELRKKLDLGQTLRLTALVKSVAEQVKDATEFGPTETREPRWGYVYRHDNPARKLLTQLREWDRGEAVGYKRGRIGTGKHVLLNPAMMGWVDAGNTLAKARSGYAS